jgi:hypothetical protein
MDITLPYSVAPSARRASAANTICKPADIFRSLHANANNLNKVFFFLLCPCACLIAADVSYSDYNKPLAAELRT